MIFRGILLQNGKYGMGITNHINKYNTVFDTKNIDYYVEANENIFGI